MLQENATQHFLGKHRAQKTFTELWLFEAVSCQHRNLLIFCPLVCPLSFSSEVSCRLQSSSRWITKPRVPCPLLPPPCTLENLEGQLLPFSFLPGLEERSTAWEALEQSWQMGLSSDDTLSPSSISLWPNLKSRHFVRLHVTGNLFKCMCYACRLQRWLNCKEYILLFRVQCLVTMSGGLQLPIIPAPGDLTLPSGLCGYLHSHVHRYTHTIKIS